MYQELQRINNDTVGTSDGGNDPLQRKLKKQTNLKSSSEVHGVSSLIWSNSDNRYSVFSLFTLEANGHRRIFALPLHFPDQSKCFGSGALDSMDCLHLVCPQPINSVQADRQVTDGSVHAGTYSANSRTSKTILDSTVQRQSQKKAIPNKTKWNELPQSFCKKSLTSSESSCLISNSVIKSSNTAIQSSDVDNVIKKSSRKKSRKKGKRGKKNLHNTVSKDPEIFPEECPKVSSMSRACHDNSIDQMNVLALSSTALDASLQEGRVHSSQTQKTCTSYSTGVDTFEEAIPAFHKIPETCSGGTSKKHIPSKDSAHFVGDDSQIYLFDALHPRDCADKSESFLLDPTSTCSNSDDGTKLYHGTKHSEKERCRTDLSESPASDFGKEYSSCSSLLNNILDSSDHTNKTKITHGSGGRNGSQVHVVIPGKKTKQNKSVARMSSVSKCRVPGNLHGHTGKENSHSVWQKVQRNGTCDSVDDLKKLPVLSQFDNTLDEVSLCKKNCDSVVDEKQFKDTRSWKSKSAAGFKHESRFSSRKGSHADRVKSDGCAKFTASRKDMVHISSKTNEAKHMTPESVTFVHVCPNAIDSLDSISNANSSTKSETIEDLNHSLPKSCNSNDQSKLDQVQSPVHHPYLSGNSVGQGQKTVLAEDYLQTHTSGSVMQKWIPIGLKDCGLTNSSDSSPLENSDGLAAEIWTIENPAQDKVNCDSQNPVPKAGVVCMAQSSKNISSFSPDDECRSPNFKDQDTSMLEEQYNRQTAAHTLDIESGAVNAIKPVQDKIAEAVNDACRVQLASEAIEQASGHPVAEFERVLKYSRPVISYPTHLSCHSCSRDQLCGVSLCTHETLNISLGGLWKWYEKHGNYGLEIKANDYENSRRLGANTSSFCAYFVPYLSAVQLFGNYVENSVDTSNTLSSSEVLDLCEFNETSESSSSLDHLPMFSVLFPQPQKEFKSYSNEECSSESSSTSAKDVACLQSVERTLQSDPELLFEYFESEQPQKRRPLYEKIDELIRGDGPVQYQGYGDPTILNSVKLNDLHPRSWYAVAWYPIYRIPEGNLRSSFLTFHSLGHLVHQHGMQPHIVAPVVGLQTYNAQGECWFRIPPSLLNQKKGASDLDPSEIMKQRLRTLEETASLMARAVVKKENLTSVNRHPDYEFFCLRKRC
ncbi:uncharacterized protein LOC133823944 isoform X2 [Humulus lupulus]|nr:uncharacterized protein LOC133823944 isoform X2 [Humulus lupulus]